MPRIARAALGMLVLQVSLGQAQTPAPQFDVASVKLNPNCNNFRGGGSPPFSPGRINMECTTLQNLIMSAYVFFENGALNYQMIEVTGGPGWVATDRYDVAAKAEGGAPVGQMMGPMLRALLEDRFKLKVHRESKETAVYALSVGKGGLKLEPIKEGACLPIDLNHLPAASEPGQPRPNFCGNMSIRSGPQAMVLETKGVTIKEFASRLSNILDRTVVDKTGVSGQFDFHLEFAPDETTRGFRPRSDAGAAGTPSTLEGPSVISALEKLGLKLTPDKAPVDTVVIDHAEKPTEN